MANALAQFVQVRKTIQLQWLCTGRNRMGHVFIDGRVVTSRIMIYE